MGRQPTDFDYDLAVIGGGSAGYAAARVAVGYGLRTAVIEGGKELGGLCILRGCMPTKALLYAAEVLHLTRHPDTWGIRAEKVGFDFAQVMARKNAMIEDFASYRRQQLLSGKFRLLRAEARFVDPHRVQLSDGQSLTAGHFVVATGSTHAPYPLHQLGEVGCINSDIALELEKLPRSVIVIGGGAVATEFAQLFTRFGVQVTMIQRSAHVLRGFDADAAEVLESVLRREGVDLYAGTRLVDARRVGEAKEVTFEHQGQCVRVQADALFYALGRQPNIASLGLEQAGVELDGNRIAADTRMQTSVPHIYAAGDCTGLHEIVHIAIQQGETAAHNIAGVERKIDYRLLTEVVFTEPQAATVGLTEKRAQAQKVAYLSASYPFNDHGKSLIMEAKDGFVKLLANPATGEILGGACVGPLGGELIHEIIAAMHKRMTVHELATMPHYHPTLAEIWTYPAEELAEKIPARSGVAEK